MKGVYGAITSRVPAPQRGSLLWRPWLMVMKANTALYRASGGRLFGRFDAAPTVLLHHVGAKSGAQRTTPLVYLADGDDLVIVGSMGGTPKHPAWVHNLRANPDCQVEIRGRRRAMRAVELKGAERERLWPRLLEVWPAWEDYQRRTDRRFPVFRLSPSPPTGAP